MAERSRWQWIAAGIGGLAIGFGLSQLTSPWPARTGSAPRVSASEAGQRVRETLAVPDRLTRLAELGALLRQLGPDAVPEVQAAFAAAPLDRGDPELIAFAIWWAGFDPKAAYAWTARDWRGADGAVLAAIFRTWGAREPELAWQTAQTITFRGHREFCADSVIAGWDETNPTALIEFVQKLPAGPLQQRAAEVVARRRVIALGAQGALDWVNTLADAEFRAMLSPRIASAATVVDPSVAAKWAEPQIAAAKRPTGLPRRIATRWVLSDPDAAFAWLASLPAGYDRDDGVTEAFRDWQRRDPIGSKTWIERTEMQRWNEPAFGLYARGMVAAEDPAKALAIVGRLTDQELRDYLTTVIGRAWLEREPEAADAWIKQADLPKACANAPTWFRARIRIRTRAAAARPSRCRRTRVGRIRRVDHRSKREPPTA